MEHKTKNIQPVRADFYSTLLKNPRQLFTLQQAAGLDKVCKTSYSGLLCNPRLCTTMNQSQGDSMSTRKYVYPRPDMGEKNGKKFINVHYLIGYNQRTPADYLAMTAVIAETFPEATADTVNCSIVTRSSSVRGFTLAIWNGWVEKNHDFTDWYVVKTKKDANGEETAANPDYSFA
ncbi:MAG: hypothetical protein NT003_01020 [Candidatus Magasanikbacteria bacterium]|nr:hypothetical protein [Candidatus Magasanikbacteria bacterium]